jgi:hypothetical protein
MGRDCAAAPWSGSGLESVLDFIQFIAQVIDRIVHASIRLFNSSMNFLEGALRGPLQSIGIHGPLQTLFLTLIPILTLVVVVKLFSGFFRALFVLVLVLILLHVALPLFTGSPIHVEPPPPQ